MTTEHRSTLVFLVNHGLLNPDAILYGKVRVRDMSRRNINTQIINSSGTSLFVKQRADKKEREGIAREAEVYSILGHESDDLLQVMSLPDVRLFDSEAGVLVLKSAPGSQDMRTYYRSTKTIPTPVAETIGVTLASLHHWTIKSLEVAISRGLKARPPSALGFHLAKLDALRVSSQERLKFIELIQAAPQLTDGLNELRDSWDAVTWTHGDIRWDNFLLWSELPSNLKLLLVDWELAGIGDPSWDVGSVFAEFVASWLFSISLRNGASDDDFVDNASQPLGSMQVAIRSFWQSYMSHSSMDSSTIMLFLHKSVRYSAARLLQVGLERMTPSTPLTGHFVRLIQLSANMMQFPLAAAHDILGVKVYLP